MARPREFDIDQAIADAMTVFWTYGYDATTTDQLLHGMKLTRGSLYKAFGDKKQLFLKALDLYDQREVQKAVALLTATDHSGVDRIKRLFSSIVETVEAGNSIGCLLCSTLSGATATDPDIAQTTQTSAVALRDGFAAALNAEGADRYPDTYAQLLFTHYVGLRVLTRARVPLSFIRDSVDAIDELLDRDVDTRQSA